MASGSSFGIGVPVNGDRVYHGAVDNATGVAGLVELGEHVGEEVVLRGHRWLPVAVAHGVASDSESTSAAW